MLKTVNISGAKKTAGCAVTYRSGTDARYSTCPNTCPLKPSHERGALDFDSDYAQAVIDSVPRGGVAFTYSHFHPKHWGKMTHKRGATVNFSSNTYEEAKIHAVNGTPTVLVVPEDDAVLPLGKKSATHDDVRYVGCPAEYSERVTGCTRCGDTPLCAQKDRNFVIVFHEHGNGKRLESGQKPCYGESGNVRLHWQKMPTQAPDDISDGEKHTNWVRTLPRGTVLRAHVVGDFGKL